MKEYDRLEFVERFLPCSATLAFDCMFAVGKKEASSPFLVTFRAARNRGLHRLKEFFVYNTQKTVLSWKKALHNKITKSGM